MDDRSSHYMAKCCQSDKLSAAELAGGDEAQPDALANLECPSVRGGQAGQDARDQHCSPAGTVSISRRKMWEVHSLFVQACGGWPNISQVKSYLTLSQATSMYANHNTLLMQLCSQSFPEVCGRSKKDQLLSRIYVLIEMYVEHDPALLFMRNSQDASALDLAALTNKVVVAEYLSLLHCVYGRDVNWANPKGHTLLHLLARKGDDVAETLDVLLKLRTNDGHWLYSLDVVNEGQKTPLDVAVACVYLFDTGKHRALYNQIISIFEQRILEHARHLERDF